MPSSRLAIAQLVLVMLLWGSTFVVTKAGLNGLPPLFFAFARTTVAALFLLLFAILSGRWRLPAQVPRSTVLAMAVVGVAVYYSAFNLGLRYTGAAQAALVQSSLPAVTAAFAMLFLRERPNRRGSVGILLAIAGVIAIFAQSAPGSTASHPSLGNLITLLAVIAWSVYTVMARRLAAVDPLTITAWVMSAGAAMLGGVAWLEHRGSDWPHLSLSGWAIVLYLGALPSALCFVLYNAALRRLRAAQVAVFLNLVPVVGVIASMAALGEKLSSSALLGGALVLAGVWISTRSD